MDVLVPQTAPRRSPPLLNRIASSYALSMHDSSPSIARSTHRVLRWKPDALPTSINRAREKIEMRVSARARSPEIPARRRSRAVNSRPRHSQSERNSLSHLSLSRTARPERIASARAAGEPYLRLSVSPCCSPEHPASMPYSLEAPPPRLGNSAGVPGHHACSVTLWAFASSSCYARTGRLRRPSFC